MKVGVVGCGVISKIYLQNMTRRFSNLEVIGCAARHPERAQQRAAEFGIRAMTFEEMLAEPEIEAIVNLTPPKAHADIIERSLRAGKHVYTEKVIAQSHARARELSELAEETGLLLCSAPDTFLGDSLQTARALIDSGKIGQVTGFHANINRQMGYYYEFLDFTTEPGGGMGYDLGVYYLTALMFLLGPAADVSGRIATSRPVRINRRADSPRFGQEYSVRNENIMMAILRLKSGVLGSLHFNGDAVMPEAPFFTIEGTEGILYLGNPDRYGDPLKLLHAGRVDQTAAELTEEIPVSGDLSVNSRGIAVSEMADALAHGRRPLADRAMGVHALEIFDGIVESDRTGRTVPILSPFERPGLLKDTGWKL